MEISSRVSPFPPLYLYMEISSRVSPVPPLYLFMEISSRVSPFPPFIPVYGDIEKNVSGETFHTCIWRYRVRCLLFHLNTCVWRYRVGCLPFHLYTCIWRYREGRLQCWLPSFWFPVVRPSQRPESAFCSVFLPVKNHICIITKMGIFWNFPYCT